MESAGGATEKSEICTPSTSVTFVDPIIKPLYESRFQEMASARIDEVRRCLYVFTGGRESIILCENSATAEALKKADVSNIAVLPALDSESKMKMRRFGLRIATEWYNSVYNDGDQGSKISLLLGRSLEQQIISYAYNDLVLFERFSKYIAKRRPKSVLIPGPLSPRSRILEAVCEERGVESSSLLPRFVGRLGGRLVRFGVSERHVRDYYDNVRLYVKNKIQEVTAGGVLVDAPYANHLGVTLPVAEALEAKTGRAIAVLTMSGEMPSTEWHAYLKKRTDSTKRIADDVKDRLFEALCHYDAEVVGISPGLWKLIVEDVKWLLSFQVDALVDDSQRFSRYLSLLKPRVLLVGDDRGPPVVRLHALISSSYGIDVYEVQHGIFSNEDPYASSISRGYFVWDHFSQGVMLALGAKPSRVWIVGAPVRATVSLRNEWKGKILLVTQPPYRDQYRHLMKILGEYCSTTGRKLVVKPHPAESEKSYSDMAMELGDSIEVVDGRSPIDDLISECSLVVTVNSSVAIKARTLSRPVVFYDIGGVDYAPFGPDAVVTNDSTSLVKAVGNAMDYFEEPAQHVRNTVSEIRGGIDVICETIRTESLETESGE